MASSSEAVKEVLVTKSGDYAGRSDFYTFYTVTLGTYVTELLLTYVDYGLGLKGFTFGKWFIGQNVGIEDGAESKFGTNTQLIV